MDKLTYSVAEGAQVMGVHELTLRKYIDAGLIPAVRVGRRVLIPVRALEAFLEGSTASQQEGTARKAAE